MSHIYTSILKAELIPAYGCTEPAAIAYAASTVRKHLGDIADSFDVYVSGNVIKNVQGVIVPNTNERKGIRTSVIAGSMARNPDDELEVLHSLKPEDISRIDDLLESIEIKVNHVRDKVGLYIEIIGRKDENTVRVIIEKKHTNLTLIQKNGSVIYKKDHVDLDSNNEKLDYSVMNFGSIYDYIQNVCIQDIKQMIDAQITNNLGIAKIGLKGDYGLNIGKSLLMKSETAEDKASAYAAAGSDTRMGGSDAPVIINSGSGNQGITVSLPVYVYGKEMGAETTKIYRALLLSNLISIYIKSKIGVLSAFCGAVSAATAAGAGITYLKNGTKRQIQDTINNSLANLSGVICDGAKASCAYKIASSVDSAILASELAIRGQVVEDGSGVIFSNVDKTIEAIGKIGKIGMKKTDEVILDIMTS